jgi:aminoglycoside 6'-N-acetyltransferase I
VNTSIQVRPVEPGDRAEWITLRLALWPDEDEQTHRAAVERYFATSRSLGSMPEAVFVATLAGADPAMVGFAEVSRRSYAEGCETSPVGFLEGWYVIAERRGAGAGRALLAAAEAWARGLGCREFASDAVAENTLSAAAHRALGFEEVVVIRCFRKSLTGASDHPTRVESVPPPGMGGKSRGSSASPG